MSVVVATSLGDARPGWRPVMTLARIEARRYATRVSVWAGWLAMVAVAVWHRSDWPGGAYEEVLPLAPGFGALGTFVAGVRTGGRDHDTEAGPLAEEAGLGDRERAAARLAGLAVPVGLAVLMVLAVAVVSRIEGGFWLGEGPRRTDSARHTPAELLQPVLFVALAGALGVSVGARVQRSVLAIAAGVFVWTAVVPLAWMWNAPGRYPVAPLQAMPLRVPLPDVRTFADMPADWFGESPTQYEPHFTRSLVHTPTVVLHDLFLLGLLAVVVAWAWPARRGQLRVGGAVLAVAAVAGQFAVSPF